jgi:outer membrane protein insertion porin family
MTNKPHLQPAYLAAYFLLPWALLTVIPCDRSAHAQEGYRISAVSFEGNAQLSSDFLEEHLLSPPTGWFGTTFMGDIEYRFSQSDLELEIQNLRRLYQTEGFPDVRIGDPVIKDFPGSETVEVTFPVEEGRSIGVGMVELLMPDSDGRLDSLAEVMRSAIRMERGDRFRDDGVLNDRDILLNVLSNVGYPYARAEYSITVRDTADTADIRWNIEMGPLCRFGPVTVNGAEMYNEELITDRIAFRDGEKYKHFLLEKTQRDIFDLRLYRTVSASATRTGEQNTVLPVLLDVQEASRYRAEIGVGYGRDEKLRYTGKIDVFGVFRTAGRMGVEVRRSELEPFTLLVNYQHPDVLGTGIGLGIDPFLRREDEPAYESKRVGYTVTLHRPVVGDLLASVLYSYERVTLGRYPSVPVPPNFSTDYPKESVGLTVGYNSARPLFSPHGGFSIALSGRFSGIDLFYDSPYKYTTTVADIRAYTLPLENVVTAFRMKVGTIISHDQPAFVPFEDRFYAGGSLSIRGWGRSLLGPLDAEGTPTGGSSILETGIEVRVPDTTPFSIVLFVDAGNVWETSGTYKLDGLEYAGGIGVRYATPIGPVRLDFAHPIFQSTGPWQWWFSIGHAF